MRFTAVYNAMLMAFAVLASDGGVLYAQDLSETPKSELNKNASADAGEDSLGDARQTKLVLVAAPVIGFQMVEIYVGVAPSDEVKSEGGVSDPVITAGIKFDRGGDTRGPSMQADVPHDMERWPQGMAEWLSQGSRVDPIGRKWGQKSMVFRFGSRRGGLDGSFLPIGISRATPEYEASFGFEPPVVTAHLEYELLQEKWGLGAPTSCLFSTLSCQWRAVFHLEGGQVLDAGDMTNLVYADDFLQAGLSLNFTFQPTFSPLDRLESEIGSYYIEDLTGDGKSKGLSEKIVFWRLDDDGQLRLRARYRHGDLPLIQDKLTILTLGLEVKF